MKTLFPPPAAATVSIFGQAARFPVHRIYCMARNYAEHAKEMGFTGLESPFFFLKPADTESLLVVEPGQPAAIRYPSFTKQFYHEIELVLAIDKRGKDIKLADAHKHIYGYAAGLDMNRQDLLIDMMRQGRPWCIGKSYDHSAAIGPITPAAQIADIEHADIHLSVNGAERQRSNLSHLIWNGAKVIEQLSMAWELQPGDLIFTGTPPGVGPVLPGDLIEAGISGLEPLKVQVVGS